MRRSLLAWLALVALALAWGYHGLLASGFLRDDFMWLYDSGQQLAHPIEFLTTRPSGYLRPFANLFFGLERLCFGLDPRGYFVVNVLLHGWNAVWLGILVLTFGGSARFAGAAMLVSASLASAFPSVVWISGLVSLLALAMVLPALFFYEAHLRSGRRVDYLLALGCLVLAVCSRESGVLAGLGVLVLELRRGVSLARLKSVGPWARLLPLALLGLVYLGLQRELLTGGAGSRLELGSPLAFASNLVTGLPRLVQPGGDARSLSLAAGLGMLALAWLLLGGLGGRRGLAVAATLTGLLFLLALPIYPLLSRGAQLALRYEYELGFGVALLVAGSFDALLAGLRLAVLLPARRVVAVLALALFVGVQLEALPGLVHSSPRYGAYARATQRLAAELEAHFGGALGRAAELEPGDAVQRVALVGVPVENLRHLQCQLAVWYGLDLERVHDVQLSLAADQLALGLLQQPVATIEAATGSDEVWLWDQQRGLVRSGDWLAGLQHNWRRPARPLEVAFVRVLELPLGGGSR